MRLNWFSPLPPARTGIADYTARVLPTLRGRADLVVWTDQKAWDPKLEDVAEVRHYDLERMPWMELNRGDMSIYHMGNDPAFHGNLWQVSCRHPGVIVLHDLCLQGLFAGLYREHWHDRDGYIDTMERLYGGLARRDAEAFWDGRLTIAYLNAHYPLTALAVENALGVLVHWRDGVQEVTQDTPCPVVYAPLPYAASPRLTQRGAAAARMDAEGSPYRIIAFGHMHVNRRLDAILGALAGLPEKDRFRLHIYGRLWDEGHVRHQIHALGLDEVVTVHGFVPEDELEAALAAAHLAVNLRYPTMGEASVSQLQLFDHALPTLVTQVGWYAGLPANAVAFVRPDHEIEDIRGHLRAFVADPARYAAMGECGRCLLEAEHRPEVYVQALVDLVSLAERWRSYAAVRETYRRVTGELQTWMTSRSPLRPMQVSGQDIWGYSPEPLAPRRVKRLDRQHVPTFRAIQEATLHQADRMRLESDATLQAIRQVVGEAFHR